MKTVRVIAKLEGVTVFDDFIPNYYDVAFWMKSNYGKFDELHSWAVPDYKKAVEGKKKET